MKWYVSAEDFYYFFWWSYGDFAYLGMRNQLLSVGESIVEGTFGNRHHVLPISPLTDLLFKDRI